MECRGDIHAHLANCPPFNGAVSAPHDSMTESTKRVSYPDYVAALKRKLGDDAGLRSAVGGDFIATGMVEEQLLRSLGLQDGQSVVDVGCGSGRLAYQLTKYPKLNYLGTDVVADLLRYAKTLCARAEWRFEAVEDMKIPAADRTADFVCFFSVFTHLLHEQTYRYLSEAARVIAPGGKIVFSFLEFRLPCHWTVFEESVCATDQHLNQFIDREGIMAWARHLGLVVDMMADGDRPHIPLETEVRWPDGRVMAGMGNLGQSVAVLRLPNRKLTKPLDAHIPELQPKSAVQQDVPVAPAHDAYFIATSVRGHVGGGHAALIAGFSLAQAGSILVRASGERLLRHGIRDVLSRPHLSVYDLQGQLVSDNGGWSSLPAPQQQEISAAVAMTTSEPLDPLGSDASLLLTLGPGAYTAIVRGQDEPGGVVLLEITPLPGHPARNGTTE